jgi:sulfatase modifying factor 1
MTKKRFVLCVSAVVFGIAQSNAQQESATFIRTDTSFVDPVPHPDLVYCLPYMVQVEAGTFTMGCAGDKVECDADENPSHTVTLDGYGISMYEVTQVQWQSIMGNNPSAFLKCPQCPVEQVSYEEIQEFLTKLNKQTCKAYRLPTEAEWEYAARGGHRSLNYIYSGSSVADHVAWFDHNSKCATHAVGQLAPNELGLFDMSGNVWEWCSDWYSKSYYATSPALNPKGPSSGNARVVRGGSWYYIERFCRVSDRGEDAPNLKGNRVGFRLAHD